MQLEQRDGPSRRGIIADELRADHPPGREPKTIPVEGESPIQIGDSQRDYVDSCIHRPSFPLLVVVRSEPRDVVGSFRTARRGGEKVGLSWKGKGTNCSWPN